MSLFGDGEREIARAIRESTHELLYKRIPKQTPITKEEASFIKDAYRQIDENLMMTDIQKSIAKMELYQNMTSIEVER